MYLMGRGLFDAYSTCIICDTLMVEAMHAPHFLLIFKISEVRHLDVSAFSGCREFRKAVMHLDLRSSF